MIAPAPHALRALRSSRLGRGSLENQEFTEYSAAVQETRHLANDRMRQDAAQGLADGVVGLYLDAKISSAFVYSDARPYNLIVRVLALGTAITTHRDRWPLLDYAVSLSG